MTMTIREGVAEGAWTDAFARKSVNSFAMALAPDVVLESSTLVTPIRGRERVATTMAEASKMFEHIAFIDQATNGRRKWLAWEAHMAGGIDTAGVTVLTMNEVGEIAQIWNHHRPLLSLLKFSESMGNRLLGVIDRYHFHR
jgi:hypothetical protein